LNKFRFALVFGLLLAAAIDLSTPPQLRAIPVAPALPDAPEELAAWVTARESAVGEAQRIIPGTEKRIRWFADAERTPFSVVYLHGFSATRQETAPLAERVADALGANLFETRLAGHGLDDHPLAGTRAEDWLADGLEALEIGRRLGDRVIIIATSTGATLAAALLDQPGMSDVDAIVMISPNFAPRDTRAAWVTAPGGWILARAFAGPERSWQAHNERQARFWTTRYPIAAAVEMMRLVDRANRVWPAALSQRLLVFYSHDDAVVSAQTMLAVLGETDAADKMLIEVTDSGDPSRHVLAGDILSPATTDRVVASISGFILRRGP